MTARDSNLPDNHLVGAVEIDELATLARPIILPMHTAKSKEISQVPKTPMGKHLQSYSPGGTTLRT